MMIEYWLQKKSLGGWSMVTWYSDLDQAMTNYNKCIGNGMSGYSWRLCKVEAIETSMLQEVTEIQQPCDIINQRAGHVSALLQKTNSWNEPKRDSWSDIPSDSSLTKEHGLSGSVWVINHALKEKKRVPASELDALLAQGYERAGPRTAFK